MNSNSNNNKFDNICNKIINKIEIKREPNRFEIFVIQAITLFIVGYFLFHIFNHFFKYL